MPGVKTVLAGPLRYIARSGRVFDLRYSGHPSLLVTLALSLAIYANFFLHHYFWDFRYVIAAAVAVAFRRCSVHFLIGRVYHRMPMLLAFVLIALFIWFAENVGTFSHAWLYPNQMKGWELVSAGKLGSWFLLTIMSYVMVTLVRRPRPLELTSHALLCRLKERAARANCGALR